MSLGALDLGLLADDLAGAGSGMAAAFAALAVLAVLGTFAAAAFWPRQDPEIVPHVHDLPPGHPHLADGDGGRSLQLS